MAEYAFEQNGYVCGAAFSDDFRSVHHIMIDNRADLDKLRRSKYLQSENGNIYNQVKEKLIAGKFVLFVGTPCQCAALKTFLRKPYQNLLIVDLICHGTPSPMAWNRFLNEVAPNQNVHDVNFRYKELIGWSATTHVEFDNNKEYTKLFKDCMFEQASSKNLISRKSCATCQFARVPRQGDITIGDFWGIHQYSKTLDDRKGTSAVLLNNTKGLEVFTALKDANSFKKVKEIPFYQAFARNNSNVYRYPHAHPGRQSFFDALERRKKFSEALYQSKSQKYDIMLFSIWYALNFGSMMTNFALYELLTDMGYNCIFADIPDHLWPESKKHRDHLFITRRFAYKHFQLTGKYKNRIDLKKVNDLADTFIVGSDQIWNYKLCKSAETYFYLDFVNDEKRKIAYGTSFGHKKFNGGVNAKRTAGYYLNRFDAVSVREDYAVDLCRNEFGVDAVQVLDPVFMCNKQHYLDCIAESRVHKNPPKKKYILAYILDPTEEKQVMLEQAAKRKNLDLLIIPNAHVKEEMRKAWRLPLLEDLDMEDWLYYFYHADMVITDSFHGTCFSLIFEKPFIAIGNKRRGLERFNSLLGNFDLMDRLIFSASEAANRKDLFTETIDYTAVNAKLAALRDESMTWLRNALNAPAKPPIYSAYDLVDRRIDTLSQQFNKKMAEFESLPVAKPTSQNSTAKSGEIAALETRTKQLEKRLNQLSQQLEEQQNLTNQLIEMENSLSWKITKPIRSIQQLIKKKDE